MLTELREKSQSFGIYILFGILIVVFIFFFGPQSEGFAPGGPNTNLNEWAAEVGGEEISQREVEISVRRQALYDPDFDADAAALAALRRLSVMQIIEQATVEQEARRVGITVSDEQLSRYIVSDDNPDFPLFSDRAGNFDAERYRAQLTQSLGATADAYRRAKRRELIAQRYLTFLGSQIAVGDAEARAAFDKARRTWDLEFLAIDPAVHAADLAEPTAEEGAKFAADNADAVKAHYEENESTYKREKEIKIRRVLVRKPKEGGDEAEAAAKAKAEALRTEAMADGADFAAIAKEKSEGYYKAYDGDMGWQSKGNTSEKDYAVFAALEKGQISEVQASPIGFWFVKADDVKPAIDKSLDDVKNEIGVLLARKGKRTAAARAVADEVLAKVKAGASLQDAAPMKPLPKPAAPAVPAAPTPVEGGEGNPTEGDEAPAGDTPAEDAVPAAPAAPAAPAPIAEPIEVQTTGAFSADRPQWDRIPNIGKSAELATKLAGLTAEKPLLETPVEVDGKLYVVRLKERVEPTDEAFAKDKETFVRRLRDQRAARLLGNWQAVLFGPLRQRDVFRRFSGGALMTLLARADYELNPEVYPPLPAAPAPGAPPVPAAAN